MSAVQRDPIGLPIAFSVALKQVIGGGVIVLTGTAVGLTGAGASVAYMIACLVVLLVSLPYAVLGAARPMSGALYRWPARFIHPRVGFLGFWMVLGTHVALAAYAATFGSVLHAMLPMVPAPLAGVAALALVLGLNLLGTEVSGRANIAIVVVVAAALAALASVGLPKIDPHHLLPLLPHGWFGMLGAAALLTFPISGATLVSELAGEMKRPARDVPVAILGATAAAAALYVAVALVAAGVPGLPPAPALDVVAKHVMGPAGAAAFAIGTGIVSMLGIMNTHLLWGSRSILMVCRDGWLPRRLGRLNRRGAPVFPLCLLGAIGALPLVAGIDIADVLRIGGLGASGSAILSIACAPLNARADPGGICQFAIGDTAMAAAGDFLRGNRLPTGNRRRAAAHASASACAALDRLVLGRTGPEFSPQARAARGDERIAGVLRGSRRASRVPCVVLSEGGHRVGVQCLPALVSEYPARSRHGDVQCCDWRRCQQAGSLQLGRQPCCGRERRHSGVAEPQARAGQRRRAFQHSPLIQTKLEILESRGLVSRCSNQCAPHARCHTMHPSPRRFGRTA